MMDTKFWPIVGLFLCTLMGYAQDNQPLLPNPAFDRPGYADAPYFPAKGSWQLEAGTGFLGSIQRPQPQWPAFLLRWTVASGFEWRAQANYVPPLGSLDRFLRDESTHLLAFGAKMRCGREWRFVPEWALMGNFITDTRSLTKRNSVSALGWDLFLLTMHNLPHGFSLNGMLGIGRYPSAAQWVSTGALTVNWAMNSRWGFFGEVFGFHQSQTGLQQGWDIGMACYVDGQKAQWDLSWMNSDLSEKGGGVLLLGYSRNFSNRVIGGRRLPIKRD